MSDCNCHECYEKKKRQHKECTCHECYEKKKRQHKECTCENVKYISIYQYINM